MISMLGKQYNILEVNVRGNPMVIALPSPDGSQCGKWYFSKCVVSKPGCIPGLCSRKIFQCGISEKSSGFEEKNIGILLSSLETSRK